VLVTVRRVLLGGIARRAGAVDKRGGTV
jgi:hypothetical protein